MNIRQAQLPQGWEILAFEKCLEKVTYTRKIKRKDFKKEGVYPIVSQEKEYINGYWDNENDLFKVERPVVIFGDHTQVVKYVDFSFVLGADGVKILKPIKDLDPRYFFYYLQNIDLGSLGYARHYRLLKEIKVIYPKSLPEQQRIVSILDEAFAAIDKAKANAEQNILNAKDLFESYLQGVFENKSDGWEEKLFEELIQEKQIGLIKSNKEQGNDKTYRYLKMDSITSDNYLVHDKYAYVDADKTELDGFTLNDGDFLFNTRNSYELVGKTCVFTPIDEEPTLFNNNIMRVVFKKGISSRFINYAFSSEIVKERLQKLKSGTTSVVGIYYKGLRNLKIPITKYEEQQTIVRKLDALRAETQKLESVYQKKMDDLEELKKSILQKAFNGEL